MTIAATALVAFGLWGFWPASTAQAGTQYGELQLSPDHLGMDRTITAEYRPGSILAGAEAVVLRARFRTANNPPYNGMRRQVSVAQLHRDRDGVYRGSFTVPDSVVYAALAVEDLTGKRVDHNAWRLWDLLQEISSGQPTFAALGQQANDLQGRSMEEALRTTQRRASLYPDLPQSWGALVALEQFMLGSAHADSTAPAYRARLYKFDEEFRSRPAVPFETIEGMLDYAVQLSDSGFPRVREIARYWRKRYVSDTSSVFPARMMRAEAISDSARISPKKFLPVLDSLWTAGGQDFWFVPQNASIFAESSGDDAASLLWTDRLAAQIPDAGFYYYGALLKKPALADTALAWLRASLPRLYTRQDSLRPLERNVEEQARADSRVASAALKSIGANFIARGRVQEGIEALDRASEGVWDVDAFRTNAEARLTAGDTAGALRPLAFVSVDPETSDMYRDSVLNRVGTRITPQRWNKLVDSAASEMRQRVPRDEVSLSYGSPVRVATEAGRQTSLAELTKGKVAVVTFWSRYCGPSRQRQIPKLDRLARDLKRYDIVLIPITSESPSKDLTDFLRSQNVTAPVYYDRWREAGRAFSQWGTPQYDIVDGEGRIRFAHTTQGRVLAQAVALSRVKPEHLAGD
jgi:peroxiredoxin